MHWVLPKVKMGDRRIAKIPKNLRRSARPVDKNVDTLLKNQQKCRELAEKALELVKNNQIINAVRLLRLAVQRDPENLYARINYAEILYRNQEIDESQIQLDEILIR